MRTFRLLATSLLVALSMGVSSCSEELDSQPMESYPEGGEPLDVVCKEYGISDYEDIELLLTIRTIWSKLTSLAYEKRSYGLHHSM